MLMPTIRDLLIEHPALCVECIIQKTHSRSETVFHELRRLGLIPSESSCATCAGDALVYSIRR